MKIKKSELVNIIASEIEKLMANKFKGSRISLRPYKEEVQKVIRLLNKLKGINISASDRLSCIIYEIDSKKTLSTGNIYITFKGKEPTAKEFKILYENLKKVLGKYIDVSNKIADKNTSNDINYDENSNSLFTLVLKLVPTEYIVMDTDKNLVLLTESVSKKIVSIKK